MSTVTVNSGAVMTTTIHVEVTVEDFDRFYEGFQTRGLPLRERHGSRGVTVLRHAGEPAKVSLIFDWSSAEAFRGFLADPDVKASMAKGGTLGTPRVSVLEEVGRLES